MKTAVIYASMTGHSKKIAQRISQELSVPVYNINEKPRLEGYDLMLIVSGIYGGGCKPELLAYVNTLTPDDAKSAALITSSATKVTQRGLRNALTERGIAVKEEEYVCEGSFLFKGFSHPNQEDIAAAVEFAKECITGKGKQ